MVNLNINKYSKKCIKEIKDNIVFNINKINHPLLDMLESLYKKTIDDNYKHAIILEKELNQLHKNSEYPLLYIHYLESSIKKKDFEDYNSFYSYYVENVEELAELINQKSRVLDIIKNPPKDRERLHKNIYDNHFVTLDIHQLVETNKLKYYELDINSNKIFIYEFEDKKINLELVCFIVTFMENLANKYGIKHNKLNLTLLGSPQKKLITNNKFLGPENINSGSTYYNNKVFLWRIEEIYKVLIHELIHFYGFDHNLFMRTLSDNKINKHCVDGEDRENEAYTESFALIIHTFILSKFLKINFYELFKYEINFSIYQCKKILNFFKIENVKDIIYNNSCGNPINQKTSVFSYFLIKTSLIMNLKETMDFILKNDHSNFQNLIKKSLESNNMEIINSIKLIKEDNFINKTMRMTCLEFS